MKKFLSLLLGVTLLIGVASAAILKDSEVPAEDSVFTIQHFPGYEHKTKLVFEDGTTYSGTKFDGSGQIYSFEKFETKMPGGDQVLSFCADFSSVSVGGNYVFDPFEREMNSIQKLQIVAALDYLNDMYGLETIPAGRAIAQIAVWNILLGDQGYFMNDAGKLLVKFEGTEDWYIDEYSAIVDGILDGSIDAVSIYKEKLLAGADEATFIKDVLCIIGVSGDNYWQQRQIIPVYDNFGPFVPTPPVEEPQFRGSETAWGGWVTANDFIKFSDKKLNTNNLITKNNVVRSGKSAWAMAIEFNGTEKTVDLVMGQHTVVGTVTIVDNYNGTLSVIYDAGENKLANIHCGAYADLTKAPNGNGNLMNKGGTVNKISDGKVIVTLPYATGTSTYVLAHSEVNQLIK